MRKLCTLLLCLLPIAAAAGTGNRCTKTAFAACSNNQTTAVSATPLQILNEIGGVNASFEYLITGAPATLSCVLQGCEYGNTCDTLDTYTTVANTIKKPANFSAAPNSTTLYNSYQVTCTWTGGTAPTFTVNTFIKY